MAVGQSHGGGSVEWYKGSFFDAGAVMKEMDKATRRVFSRFGAFVRQRARASIRYQVPPAQPGRPPAGHRTQMRMKRVKKTGTFRAQAVSPLRELIFFAYSAESQSLVVGPAIFAGSRQPRPGGRTIPETLERGGTATVMEAMSGGRWRLIETLELLQRTTKPTRKRQARIDARAFMAPALEAELPKLVPMYANSF